METTELVMLNRYLASPATVPEKLSVTQPMIGVPEKVFIKNREQETGQSLKEWEGTWSALRPRRDG